MQGANQEEYEIQRTLCLDSLITQNNPIRASSELAFDFRFGGNVDLYLSEVGRSAVWMYRHSKVPIWRYIDANLSNSNFLLLDFKGRIVRFAARNDRYGVEFIKQPFGNITQQFIPIGKSVDESISITTGGYNCYANISKDRKRIAIFDYSKDKLTVLSAVTLKIEISLTLSCILSFIVSEILCPFASQIK